MGHLYIQGRKELAGKVHISGAKNAVLPLMASAILSDQPLKLHNVPPLSDMSTMTTLLENLGCSVTNFDISEYGFSTLIQADKINNFTAKYDIVKLMRASILILGPLLAKYGKCSVSMPGGCSIGVRPIDLHLKGLAALGADITLENGYVHAEAKNGLRGNNFVFPVVSVTGTENVLMAAVLAKGTSVLMNVACEPEVVDLANCLNKMGAKIVGHGTPTIIVEGVQSLHTAEHTVISDRIEAGSYAIAAGITNSRLELIGQDLMSTLSDPIAKLVEVGMDFEVTESGLIVSGNIEKKPLVLETKVYPGFPTDLQAQIMALLCLANGRSVVTESIWENRFMHVPELCRMGADISVCGSTAVIKNVDGTRVMATDLRASFSLIIAALAAYGETVISGLHHLDRGYACVEKKLRGCGAIVERISSEK